MEETKSWLNQDYLSTVLKASIEDNINSINDLKVVDFKAKRALEEGKNYSSIIYKVQVWYKLKTDELKKKTYIIKKVINVIIECLGDKETEMYKVLPKIEQYTNSKFAPRLYICKDDTMVMEDLSEQGFQNASICPLDYPHCVLAVKALAKFHAGSFLLHQNDPNLVEKKLGRELFINNPSMDIIAIQEKNISKIGDEISTWPESQQYAKHFSIFAKKLKQYFENIPKRNCLKVLNHGDFHFNNMMFRYDSGKVSEVRLVDFQICRYAPPTCDLQYFIGSSADLDVRINRQDELLTVYLNTFNDTLAEIGILSRVTKQQLEECLQEDYVLYFNGLFTLCAFLGDPEDTFTMTDIELENMEEEVDKRFGNLMKSKRFREIMPEILNDLDRRGVFQTQR